MKALFVYHSENPRALKGYTNIHLLTVQSSDKKVQTTAPLSQGWSMCLPSLFLMRRNKQQQGTDCEQHTFHPAGSKDLVDSAVLQVIFMSSNITQKEAKETLGHHLKRTLRYNEWSVTRNMAGLHSEHIPVLLMSSFTLWNWQRRLALMKWHTN